MLELEIITGSLDNLAIQPTLSQEIKEAQLLDPELQGIRNELEGNKELPFSTSKDGILYMNGRLCVPNNKKIQKFHFCP